MLRIGQSVRGKVKYIDEQGNGVIPVMKDTVLVRNCFVHEEMNIVIKKKIQKGYIGEIKQISKPAKQRVKPECGIYERCGSCQLMHMAKEDQKEYKKKRIMEMYEQARMPVVVKDVLTMKHPYAYRNKMIIGFTKDKNRHIQAGFYEEFTHQIIPYKRCLLHPKECDEMIASILTIMEKLRIEPYDEKRRSGILRHVLIRYGEVTKQIMVVLVVNSNVFPARKNFVQALLAKHPEITTIIQNVNTRKTSVVLGNEERVLYGQGYIEDVLCDCRFRISAKSFYQINHAQTQVLYQTAVNLMQFQGSESVLDAYCGIGTIGMYVAKLVKEVIGVEINKDAVKDAIVNAKVNDIKNIHFLCEDAGIYMRKLAMEKKSLDVVIMDPPRSGSSEEFIKSVAHLKVSKVLYISCNPETQLRDIKLFKKLGYEIQGDLQPVDLFPFTEHIESIVKLVRKK